LTDEGVRGWSSGQQEEELKMREDGEGKRPKREGRGLDI
jgi:hypothetical protein